MDRRSVEPFRRVGAEADVLGGGRSGTFTELSRYFLMFRESFSPSTLIVNRFYVVFSRYTRYFTAAFGYTLISKRRGEEISERRGEEISES
jgi:hypothetical protein